MTMNPFEQSTQQLLRFLTSHAELEVIDYIRQEIQHGAPDSIPTEEELFAFFQSPDEPTKLDAYQQMLATDKLLEYAEISLRTLCDLIRYQQLKEFGIVHSAKEFIQLFHPDEQEDNDLQSNGKLRKVQKKEKPGLSNSTVRGIHMMLHNALDRAVKEKLILTNPTENCIIPKIEKQEMKILHPDHISAYLNAAEQRNALPMFYLELVSGLRKGELVALQWSDLDEANCTISVSKQASWDTEHQLILSRPKTGNSIREVSIPQDAVELLKQEHAKHPSNPWMFPSSRTGEMYHPDSVVTLHKRILKDAGLEHIRFHDLRHTFATLALQNGVDVKTVSSMLGHYDAGFTLRTYTHATRQMQQKAAEKMGSFMAQIR